MIPDVRMSLRALIHSRRRKHRIQARASRARGPHRSAPSVKANPATGARGAAGTATPPSKSPSTTPKRPELPPPYTPKPPPPHPQPPPYLEPPSLPGPFDSPQSAARSRRSAARSLRSAARSRGQIPAPLCALLSPSPPAPPCCGIAPPAEARAVRPGGAIRPLRGRGEGEGKRERRAR